ncbi:MAG TPA: radical SAM/SPASM domain-containing protein [Paludibacteraceae bacterium]|nr:radical SAM/SPASM domain-containing protein [Paludibacteraceae bacterium]HRS67193.1 radical SAM/SPASM domain-containing protein [Paludibacteraceae bacterium]
MPVSLSIEPTAICQLHCPECVLGSKQLTRSNTLINFDLYKKIIDEAGDNLMYLLLYFQGEPFLSPNIFDMITYANNKNIYTATSTNAQNIDQAVAAKIVKSGLNKIIISLDGVTQKTYETYRVGGKIEKTLQAIESINIEKKLQNSRFPAIELQMIVFRHNQHEIEAFKKMTRKMNVQKVTIKTAQIYNYDEKSELIPTIKKYSRYKNVNGNWQLKKKLRNRCLRIWQSAVITTDGELLPCCFDKNASFSYGNLKEKSVTALWNSDKAIAFRKQVLSDRKNIDICQNCSE